MGKFLCGNKQGLIIPGIKIYPNPVKDRLVIDGLNDSHKTRLTVIDATGQIVLQVSIQANNYLWNIKQLHAGIYYLRVDEDIQGSTANKDRGIKFIKE